MDPKIRMNHISVRTQVFSLAMAYVWSAVSMMVDMATVLLIPAIPALLQTLTTLAEEDVNVRKRQVLT
jgi:hypothetical protein